MKKIRNLIGKRLEQALPGGGNPNSSIWRDGLSTES